MYFASDHELDRYYKQFFFCLNSCPFLAAGTKQKELKASTMQLLHQYTPQAAVLLGVLIPLCEPMGWVSRDQDTLLGYEYTGSALVAIAISSVLGLLVTLSTFLVIGATSSLTYNVVGELHNYVLDLLGFMFSMHVQCWPVTHSGRLTHAHAVLFFWCIC